MEASVIVKNEMLVLQDFERCDVGLRRNKIYGGGFYNAGQLMQYWGTLNGRKVWIELDLLEPELPMFRVAFGEAPEYPAQIDREQAWKLLQEVCDVQWME